MNKFLNPMRTAIPWILLATMLMSCTPGATPFPSPSPSPIGQSLYSLPNLIVLQNGEVQVRRHGSQKQVRIGLGSEVQVGDILRVINGEIGVFCGTAAEIDKSLYIFQSGKDRGVPCSASRAPRPMPDVTVLRGEEQQTSLIPYSLSPRSGRILANRPRLRWHPLPGEDEYTVSIEGTDGLERPSISVIGSELPYPETWPALQANGADYRVVVKAAGDLLDGSNPDNEGFSLLPESDARQLQEKIDHISQSSLDGTALSLLIAHLYLSYDLRSEAVGLLLSTPGAEQIAAIQRLLGETYLSMGLFSEAKQVYREALEISLQDELPEEQASANLGLGLVACGMAEVEDAQTHYERAKDIYQELEQDEQVKVVSELLAEVNKKCAP